MADKKNVSKSLERVVAETAMLAGETMLIAGAEISRVEDTMNRILDYSKCESHTAFVRINFFAPSIIISLVGSTTSVTG